MSAFTIFARVVSTFNVERFTPPLLLIKLLAVEKKFLSRIDQFAGYFGELVGHYQGRVKALAAVA